MKISRNFVLIKAGMSGEKEETRSFLIGGVPNTDRFYVGFPDTDPMLPVTGEVGIIHAMNIYRDCLRRSKMVFIDVDDPLKEVLLRELDRIIENAPEPFT